MCETPCAAAVATDAPSSAPVDSSEAEELSSWAAALAAMDDVSETALQQQFAYYEVRRIPSALAGAAFEPGHAKSCIHVRSLFLSRCPLACAFWTNQSVASFLQLLLMK